ncbi:MAG: hypothetical protein DRQ06_05450 [Candidatus Hydrothermota bacterium]|nr:MAG: hypothetical protein DRQ06_05450 [Candidatus Hydrothermae bacterium]
MMTGVEGVILAAGKGTRLRPITELLPKPLFPLMGKALIDWIIENMRETGIERFLLNLHHLGDMIEEYLTEKYPDLEFVFSREEELLGTGGGIERLLELSRSEFLLVHNGDTYEEFDLRALIAEHRRSGKDITWVMKDRPGNVLVRDGEVVKIGEDGSYFAGISVWNRDLLDLLPGGKFEIMPVLNRFLEEGKIRIGAHFESAFSQDAGTAEGIFEVYRHLMEKKGMKVVIEEGARVETRYLMGLVYIGADVVVEKGAYVEDAILLGSTCLKPGEEAVREIIYDGLRKKMETRESS